MLLKNIIVNIILVHEKINIRKNEGSKFILVGLEIIDKGIARKDCKIYNKQNIEIGFITSGTMSPTLSKAIALAYIRTKDSSLGSIVYIKIRNKEIKAQIVNFPFC